MGLVLEREGLTGSCLSSTFRVTEEAENPSSDNGARLKAGASRAVPFMAHVHILQGPLLLQTGPSDAGTFDTLDVGVGSV